METRSPQHQKQQQHHRQQQYRGQLEHEHQQHRQHQHHEQGQDREQQQQHNGPTPGQNAQIQNQNDRGATSSTSHHHLEGERERFRFRTRVANACDVCKMRKIKCTGAKPCGYCVKKGLPEEMCRYSGNSKTHQMGRRNLKARAAQTIPTGLASTGGTAGGVDGATPGFGGFSGQMAISAVAGGGGGGGEGDGTSTGGGLLPGRGGQAQRVEQQRQSQTPQSEQSSLGLERRRPRRSRRGSFRTITTTPREDDSHDEDRSENGEPDDTEVPRDARLVRDPQGKLIFIGDCAPLSFFQTVRRLVTARVDAAAFDACGGSISLGAGLESTNVVNAGTGGSTAASSGPGQGAGISSSRSTVTGSSPPGVDIATVPGAVEAYLRVTSGLVDLFEDDHADGLQDSILGWANSKSNPSGMVVTADATSAVNYLVLAIGHQAIHSSSSSSSVVSSGEGDPSQTYFEYARTLAFADLSGNFGIGSLQGVQVHILIALYMLFLHQTNGAFLFFGIAARAAYSIGIHRTEINARFGERIKKLREKIWRSLRVVDLFLSTSMGRPPAASDVDCTVGYSDGQDGVLNLLNASVQILLITERVVLQVYSRRKISVQLTEGISRELRDWSARWLGGLKEVVDGTDTDEEVGRLRKRHVIGACQVMASYYYAVILVSRPFLMVELHHRLAGTAGEDGNGNGKGLVSGRTKLADACIDAAVLMVSPVQDLIARGEMARRAPVLVSWLFAASLVLGLGLLSGFGRVIEKHCRASITALEYFAESDAHAVQYSLIAKSLLTTALEYLERQETLERLRRTESSSQIFGLLPQEPVQQSHGVEADASTSTITVGTVAVENANMIFGESATKGHKPSTSLGQDVLSPPRTSNNFAFSSSFFGFSGESSLPRTPEFSSLMGVSMDDADDTFGAMNLFPLLDSDGIDLTNLF